MEISVFNKERAKFYLYHGGGIQKYQRKRQRVQDSPNTKNRLSSYELRRLASCQKEHAFITTENKLLTKYAGLSVKSQGGFWSEFRVNQKEKSVFYVSSKPFAQRVLHKFSNISRFSRTFRRFFRTKKKFRPRKFEKCPLEQNE